ncbi:ABC transporter permease [Desulfatiferula olefinivorans]
MTDLPVILILSGIVAGASPVIFAALGETITEKSGIINLSLDGTLLLSAMTAFVTAYRTGSLFLGCVSGAITGMLVTLIVLVFSLYLRVSQVAVGFILTLTCRDLAYFLGNPFTRLNGPPMVPVPIPLLSDLPFAGPVFFSHTVPVYGSIILIAVTFRYLEKTPFGLRVKAVGEHPQAAYSRGIRPSTVQMVHGLIGGALVGLGGATFSLFVKAGWGRPQGCEGIGWIALALVIFGGWRPLRVALGCYLFSFLQVMGIYFQQWFPSVPSQIFQVAPFPLMIFSLVLIHVSQTTPRSSQAETKRFFRRLTDRLRATAPSSLGKPFHR